MERDVLRRFRVAQTCGCCAKPPVGKLRTVKRPEGRAPAQITVAELTHTGQRPMRKPCLTRLQQSIVSLTSLRNQRGGLRLLPVILCVVLTSARVSGGPGPGTRRMADRLQKLAAECDPLLTPFLNREAADIFGRQLQEAIERPGPEDTPSKLVGLRFKYAYELLNSGESLRATEQFKLLQEQVRLHKIQLPEDKSSLVRMYEALAWLRLGEQENCLVNHTIDSCLAPIQVGGFHKLPRGSREAIKILTEQLQANPNNFKAGWLLNIAYMTLGEHPDKVPPQWLIPPKVFASNYDIKRFYDVAGGLGLDLNDLAGSVVMDDFDNDGNLDLMISSWGLRDQMRLFRNNGDGTFTDRTEQAGLIGEVGGLNMVQADYNNDGHLDVLILRGAWWESQGHHPNSLLRNNGDGTFEDVTEAAGLLSFHPTQTATWFDFNNDGWIDLFIGNESTPGETNRCELFRNNGDGTFTECAAACGVDAIGLCKSVTSGDYDNDGLPDLYLSFRGQPNILFHNEGAQGPDKSPKGAWRFRNVALEAKVTEPLYSFPAWFFDFDNDGWLDIFVCGYRVQDVGTVARDYLGLPNGGERSRLYRNNHDGTFRDITKEVGLYKVLLGMAGNFGDLDNDGFLDFYLGTGDPDLSTIIPNRMFRNDAGQRFQDVTTSGGFGHLQKGHGIAFGDLDNDGDQDIYTSIGGAYAGDVYRNALFENPGHGNNWLKLKLVGTKSNRAAIGARIKVTVETAQEKRTIYKTVNSGGSFGGNPLRQEIGLGQAKTISGVEVFWPTSGIKQTISGLQINHAYRVEEGNAQATELLLRPFSLSAGAQDHHHHDHDIKLK